MAAVVQRAQGSVLLHALGRAFRDVLMKEMHGDKEESPDSQEEQPKKKKGKKGEKKEEKKPKKEAEEKQLVREGRSSLITYPNASSFSVFSHIRHFVLQNRLCETYNSRLGVGRGLGGEEESEGEEDVERKVEGAKMPVVVGLGVRGVFTIIQDLWKTLPPLCLRALREFLNILQGQSPAGLRNEPKETTDALFDLLMKMVEEPVEPDNQLATDLSSVACSCLLSLVVALGDTGKMLTALSSMLTAPSHLTQSTLQIPQIFYSLQDSVKAVLLGSVVEADWYDKGVPGKSLVEEWRLDLPAGKEGGEEGGMAVASDGQYLYVHGPFGLAKVGSGYGNTQKGLVYKVEAFQPDVKAWLGYAEGKLFYYPLGCGEDTVSVISTESLQVEKTLELDADCLGSQCLFSDGESIGQIKVKKEGGCVVRKFTTLCSPLAVVEEKSLQLSQKTVLCMGRAKYDSQESVHSLYQDTSDQVVRVMASRNSAAVQTASGKLLYSGSGLVFGITSKDVPKGEWREVALPDKNVKVEHCACDNAGTFCLVVSDKGMVYFGGLNKKGEAGEAAGGRGQPKPAKLKRVSKLSKQEVSGCACGGHATAMVSRDGKLYMFGSLEDDLVDKSSGVVTDLLGVPVSQVAMGRSHTAVLTQHGTVFTFGNNSFGQCGRNYKPPKEKGVEEEVEVEEGEGVGVGEGEGEGGAESSSETGDELPGDMCEQGEHNWTHSVCMICSFCGFCTGYGPGCCNEGIPGREFGMECGCGAGDSGCKDCGACKVCAGEKEHWGGFGFGEVNDVPFGGGEFGGRLRRVHEAVKHKKKKMKKKKKKQEKKEEKKEEKGGMGLQLLFGGLEHEASVESVATSSSPGAEEEEEEKEGEVSTKKPAMVVLPEDMTAMQIDCGTFHTAILLHSGEVYVFGHNNHGQLGQGNTKDCGHPVRVSLPGPAQHVACGDNHTVVLLQSGEVYTFGKHGEGQLGRSTSVPPSEEGGEGKLDDETWHLSPQLIPSLGDGCKVVWVGARGNQTFVAVNESLVFDQSLGKCQVFADSQTIGLVPPDQTSTTKSHLIVINRAELKAKKCDSDEQCDLSARGLCIDPEYNVLWSYSNQPQPTIACYNPVTTNIKDPSGTILSSSICLPRSKEASTSRTHVSLNLLSCLHTLAISPPLTVGVLAGSKMRKYEKDEYLSVVRFNAHGGGWGYSNSSVEAIQFSADTDIILGGFALYGGRGQYNAEIKLFDLGKEEGGSNETEGTLIASQTETGYTCERQHTYRMLFEKPALLTADHWYTAHVVISSPSGASSDAGSSGQRELQGPEKVMFHFKTSKRSNNGTDVGSGQIPEFLYRLPDLESEEGEELQLLGREFSSTVSPSGLKAVLQLLQWVWQNLSRGDSAHHIQSLSFIAKASLGLLQTYIREVFPEKGRLSKPSLDCPEIAEMVYEARTLLQMILSSRGPQSHAEQQPLLASVTESCCRAFRECFHAFYPSVPLKWFALCQQLQHLDPHDIVAGVPTENLLSTILEALAEPTVSYIGLGYDTTVSLNTVLYNSEPDPRLPVLSEFMRSKALEENEGGELLGFNTVASTLLAVVAAPIHSALVSKQEQLLVSTSPVVHKAGQLLLSRINEVALCIAYPESASFSGIPLRSDRKEKLVVESCVRFPEKESGHPTMEVKDVHFSVNRAIQLHGVAVYGGTGESYKFSFSILKGETVVGSREGTYSHIDYYGDSIVNITLKEPIKLEAEVIYTARVEVTGSVHDVGVDGKMTLTGPGGLSFSLHETGVTESNPASGPLVKFLYSPSVSASPQNVVQLSVHLATTLLEVTVNFLERSLEAGLTPPTLELLGSSFMFSTLLPTTLAQLGPVACRQPRYAVEVLDLVKRTLPIISVASRSVHRQSEESSSSTVYSDTKHLHYATVETEHPYKPACVTHYQVKFSEAVQWMTLEIDPRSGFAQREDKIGELLIPRGKNGLIASESQSNKQGGLVSELVGLPFEDLYADWERYSLESPPGLVLIPGNEVHISVCTETEYEKKDSNNHFGLKCQLVGYEWTSDPAECVLFLEKELVALGGMCAASLLKEDTVLPFAEELSVTDAKADTEKADMRIVQASAQEVLGKHGHVLGRGLVVDTPTIQNVLGGDIPLIRDSNEQMFLRDFISCKTETPGGRLARWLQPDRAVDPEASELGLPSEPPQTSLPAEFTVKTRDQDGKMVYVGDMKVEVKAMWLGGKEGGEKPDKMVDSVMGVRKPVFKRPYNTTKLNSNYLYHSISMMMPFSDYSFEELRLFAPKVKRSTETMPLKPDSEGCYTATWVPAISGTYLIQVFIDGKHTGQEKQIEVLDREVPQDEEQGEGAEEGVIEEEEEEEEGGEKGEEPKLETQESKEEELTLFKPKMKEFPGTATVKGLRIRAEPSFMSNTLGVINPGDSFCYVEEVKNESGVWVNLSPDSLQQLNCSSVQGFALSYSAEKKEEYLVEKEPPPEMIKTVKKTPSSHKTAAKKRVEGPGSYRVVQCGSAGHNVRSKPSMRGTPVGRLGKGNTVEAVEEVENDDGIWLKLSRDSVKKHCDAEVESWTLAVALSGRIYLAQDGDTTYQTQVIDTATPQAPAQPAFPTAASVFGTPPQKSIFGTPLVPSPPSFQFGTLKLQFGSTPELPPKPPLFKFGSQKLKDGGKKKSEEKKEKEEGESKPLFTFGSPKLKDESEKKTEEKKEEAASKPEEKEAEVEQSKQAPRKNIFGRVALTSKRAGRRVKMKVPVVEASKTPPAKEKAEEEIVSAPETEETPLPPPPPVIPSKKALSPAVAECQRAVYAAFLWQEGLVHDAIVSASYLKFHPELSKEMKREPKVEKEEKTSEGKEKKGSESEKEEKEGEAEKQGEGEAEKQGEEVESEKQGEEVESEKQREEVELEKQREEGELEKQGEEVESEKQGEEVESEKQGEEGKSEQQGEEREDKGEEGKGEKQETVEGGEEDAVKSPVPTLEAADAQSSNLALPPTLHHLVTFWDEISGKVLDNSAMSFPPPRVPSLAQELQKRYEEEKKEIEKQKKEKDKKVSPQAGGGSTVCELCDQSCPDPVTYHMKDVHPGCGKHAKGWGYNSRGTFCSGWAGNCGDGGRGGSTWYLMCKECHAKYLAMKTEVKKKIVRSVPLPKMKTKKPGKPRSLPVLTAVQGMIQNAKFLLEILCPTDNKPTATTPTAVQSPGLVAFSKQSSFTCKPDQKPVLSEAVLPKKPPLDDRPAFLRSVSLAARYSVPGSKRSEITPPLRTLSSEVKEEGSIVRQQTMDSPLSMSEQSASRPLMLKPSINLARLMYNRSKHSTDSKEIGYGKVMAFILQYHDLNGLRVAMKQSMRVAGVRAFAMECLQWLLQKVEEPSIVHDILWQFSAALCDHPVHQTAAKAKAGREKEEKGDKQSVDEDFFLGKHPLASLEGAGLMQGVLRRQFHCLLQTVANKMPLLPMGSAVQRMAMQCWCLHFQPQDHSFLLQSNVFGNISKALSGAEEGDSNNVEKKTRGDKLIDVALMENVLAKGKLKVSSNDAMANSLTDDSTETFWESRDEPRGRPRTVTVTFEQECRVFSAVVHVDNHKDSGQRVDSLALFVGREEDGLKEVSRSKLTMVQAGWISLVVPTADQLCTMLRVEVKGVQNNVRLRQLQVLGYPAKRLDSSLTSIAAQQKACEEEALRVFRLLTSQVFGGLLPMKPLEGEEIEEIDSATPGKEGEKGEEVREHMADILLAKNKLSSLQKQVCMHVIQSVHTETQRMKEEWEAMVAKGPPPKLSRQGSTVEAPIAEGEGRGSDTYCYELLSMMIGLSQSDVGCRFLSQQEKLVQALFSLLHIATSRMQLQALSLLRRILPAIGPKNLASMLEVRILPPIGYSAIAEAVNSAATLNNLGILDSFLAVVAKALSVQVKAKGRGANILHSLTGDSTISAATLACLVNPKPVPGETTIKNQRWYLKGSINQEVGSEVVKLLKDMTKGVMGAQWQGMSKAAIGQAVLHLTKVIEEARVPNPGMYSQTLWLCLAALCVIDEEHAEALSSGQWLGQDGKPKDKPLCDNHDDGETQALILCDHCGNLCGECDRVLHYSKKNKDHQRQVFKEEEEAVKVELHEGCGRIKLYWTMALVDYRTLKGLIEFREAGSGGGKGACRFCGTVSNTGLLAIGSVCGDPECQERAATVCDKTLACGHACCGVKEETNCLPCLHGCSPPEANLKQDADDMCMICYTEGLSCAPSVQLECGHVFHYHCCRHALTKRWSGPMIAFRFRFCSLCENIPISHPALSDVQEPVAELYEDVKRKCTLRLEYENQMKCEAITSPTSKFYQKPLEYAMSKYAYYVCFKCKKSYYGGEARCAQAATVNDDYDPSELVCPACSNVGGVAVQVCPKHGTDFLEYKCRYCCSVAVYFCFGTTHFCNPCHDDFQRITSIPKSELPQCPVGPCAKPLEGIECPLHVKHPLTGEEFALGCGVCRNAQTF